MAWTQSRMMNAESVHPILFDLAIPSEPFVNLPDLNRLPMIQTMNLDNLTIPKSYSYHDLGVFCKLEVQMDKKTKIPIRIRLGEYHYTERLEGKTDF